MNFYDEDVNANPQPDNWCCACEMEVYDVNIHKCPIDTTTCGDEPLPQCTLCKDAIAEGKDEIIIGIGSQEPIMVCDRCFFIVANLYKL